MIENTTPSHLIRVSLFGDFHVERRLPVGTWETVANEEWGGHTYSRSLLKWLLCASGRRALRGTLIDALWPEMKSAETVLTNAVSNLRQVLGGHGLLRSFGSHQSTGYELANQSLLWADSDASHAFLIEAENIGHSAPQAIPLLEVALRLFNRGSFLEGDGGLWCHPLRTHHEKAKKRCLLWLTEGYEAQKKIWQARAHYCHLLDVDPFDEDILCRFMAFLHRNHMTKDALDYWQEAQNRFKEQGFSLSDATRQLAKHLQQDISSIHLYLSPVETTLIPTYGQTLSLSIPAITQGIIKGTSSNPDGEDMDKIRRQLVQDILEIGGVSFLPSLQPINMHPPLSSPVTIEEFLMQCAASIKACWHLMKGKVALVEEILSPYVTPLMKLAFRPSNYQQTAARLATQVKILQAVLAMHRLDFAAREIACHEAVICGRLSRDDILLSGALMYLGYNYTYCSPNPEKAVKVFLEALHVLGPAVSLVKSDIYMGLADAYAQSKEEQKSLESINLAQAYFPECPECDPSFLYADCGWSELYQWEGRAYLHLAAYYPDRRYYKKADDAFSRSAALQSVGERSTSETIILQADAALGIKDLNLYATRLRDGAYMALSIGSHKRYSEAYEVFQRTPKRWRNETQIQEIADIFRQLPGKESSQ